MSRKYWTSKDVDYLKQHYGSTPVNELANKFGVSYTALVSKAHKLGLNSKATSGELWTQQEDDLLKQHFEYAPKHLLEEMFPNRSWAAIFRRGNFNFNLKRVSQDRYNVNYQFFSTWIQESSYVFGLIASDGYVQNNNRRSIKIELNSKDVGILEQVKTEMKYEGIIARTKRGSVRMCINNAKLIEDLISKGMPEKNKTLAMKFPDSLPFDMLPHFLRGLMDGDGSIVRHGRQARLSFLGTKELLMSIRTKIGVTNKIYHQGREGGGVYRLNVYGRQCKIILDWLYEDASIFLERKYDKYLKLTAKEHAIMQQNKQGKYTNSNYFISSLSPKRTVLLMRTQTQLPTTKPIELKLELCSEKDVIETKAALEELLAILNEAELEYKVTARTLSLVHEATKKYQSKYEKAIEAVKEGRENILDMAF